MGKLFSHMCKLENNESVAQSYNLQIVVFRASLKNVLFPSVTLCNINQGRSSLFHAYGLSENKTLLNAVLKQAYFGAKADMSKEQVRLSR